MFGVSFETKPFSFIISKKIWYVLFKNKINNISYVSLAKSALKERQILMILILTVWHDLLLVKHDSHLSCRVAVWVIISKQDCVQPYSCL